MPQEKYAEIATEVQTLTYEQKLNLLSLLVTSLQENYNNPEFITGHTIKEINSKLDEAYDSIRNEKCYSLNEVDAKLKEKYGI